MPFGIVCGGMHCVSGTRSYSFLRVISKVFENLKRVIDDIRLADVLSIIMYLIHRRTLIVIVFNLEEVLRMKLIDS